tara:strand:- start:4632 stop:4889 length:258 start_codon:yes stop_codon:yes gene_type:complete
MTFYVYMLLSADNTLTYVGYTNDLNKRLNNHNTGKGAKFTRGRRWKLIYKQSYSLKKNAMKEEFLLKKNFNYRKKIKLKYLDNIK